MCKAEEDEKQCVYHTERMYIFTQEHCWRDFAEHCTAVQRKGRLSETSSDIHFIVETERGGRQEWIVTEWRQGISASRRIVSTCCTTRIVTIVIDQAEGRR